MTGKLFTIEGPDGVGKSTVLANIKEKMKKDHPKVRLAFLRQPAKYRKEISETDPDNYLRMLYLFMRDREDQYPALVELLNSGYHICLDRYYHSSCVYQSIGNDLTMQQIHDAHGPFILQPQITFLIDANDDVIEKRLKERVADDGIENFEKNHLFREKVRKLYREMPQYSDTFNECVAISNDGLISNTIKDIWSHLTPILGLDSK